jgi:hypothetical protein
MIQLVEEVTGNVAICVRTHGYKMVTKWLQAAVEHEP